MFNSEQILAPISAQHEDILEQINGNSKKKKTCSCAESIASVNMAEAVCVVRVLTWTTLLNISTF
jgi:hypothetical protein